jgi:hypothetical protein
VLNHKFNSLATISAEGYTEEDERNFLEVVVAVVVTNNNREARRALMMLMNSYRVTNIGTFYSNEIRKYENHLKNNVK